MAEKPYRVICVTPSLIQLEITNIDEFATNASNRFTIGSYLKITDNNEVSVIAIIQSYKIKDPTDNNDALTPGINRSFIVDAQPVGFLDSNNKFTRGGQQIAIPPTKAEVAGRDILEQLYKKDESITELVLGSMALDKNIKVPIDGNRFFSKHIAVLGSTGSGKSCTVAKILQEGIRSGLKDKKEGILNNSHIVVFDIHGEYASAFPEANILTVEQLILPYWLMNSEELEEMLIESHEQNSHNQLSQFRHAVIENKKRHNTSVNITYDTPVYFSLIEVINFITNMNNEMKDAKTGIPRLKNDEEFTNREDKYFKIVEFAEAKQGQINRGPFNGEFDRFIHRLETKLADERLRFLLKPQKANGDEYTTENISEILGQLTGYGDNRSNITIIDLAGIPFEETSIVVSLISRILFDFSFLFKKNQPSDTDIPILVVYEEAHKYAPNSSISKFRSVKTAIERIAKEGRKYGISLMIVSQRPSEISETIFSQCNNFIAMRLTNPSDQNYVKRLLPDTISNLTDNLQSLEKQEAIIIGDAITLPTLVCIDSIECKPTSIDVDVLTEWQKDWYELDFDPIIKKLQKQE